MADITYLDGGTKTTPAPALPEGQATAVHCLMIPLRNDILLLPNAAVAEVTAYHPPLAVADAPGWFLGRHDWRDYQIPVIAFEKLNDDPGLEVPVTRTSRIAVLNTLNGNTRLPYIGLLTQGIPRLQVVQHKALEANPATEDKRKTYVSAFVMINGESVTIPDLDKLEKVLLELAL